MDNIIYEGSLAFCLNKEIPDKIMNKLVNLTNKIIKDKEINIEIEKLVNSGYDFSLAYLTDCSYDCFDFCTTDTQNDNALQNIKGYCLFVDVSSEIYFDGLIYDLIDYLRPYLIKNAPNYLGRIEISDTSFKKEFYVNEAFMKDDLLQFIQNLECEEVLYDSDDPEFKLGFSVALEMVHDYILRKKE